MRVGEGLRLRRFGFGDGALERLGLQSLALPAPRTRMF